MNTKHIKNMLMLLGSASAAIVLGSCDELSKHGGDAVSTATYNTANQQAAVDNPPTFPTTGIQAELTLTTTKWTCPAGTVIPDAVKNNLPIDQDGTKLICQNAGGCDASMSGFQTDDGSVVQDDANIPFSSADSIFVINNVGSQSYFMCVPFEQESYWSAG